MYVSVGECACVSVRVCVFIYIHKKCYTEMKQWQWVNSKVHIDQTIFSVWHWGYLPTPLQLLLSAYVPLLGKSPSTSIFNTYIR